MLEKGIIKPSISPWSSSIVLVRKKTKNGSIKYRFCVDYPSLKAVTKPDAYPIPNIADTLDSLGQSRIFCWICHRDIKLKFYMKIEKKLFLRVIQGIINL